MIVRWMGYIGILRLTVLLEADLASRFSMLIRVTCLPHVNSSLRQV